MNLLFDDDLVEAVVFRCARGARAGIPSLQTRRFHRERERCYAVLDPDQRNEAFAQVHRAWFREWEFEKRLAGVIANFPLLERSLQVLAFRQARTKSDESAELYINAKSERHGLVALRPERFAHEDSLIRLLHHELMHLSDLLDPAFGYTPGVEQFGSTASQQRVVRERYRLLWDVTIDGRLTRMGRVTVASLEQRQREFESAYAFLIPEKRRSLFDSLWNAPPDHPALVELASDPRALTASRALAPGAPCPLCGFASFDWADPSALMDQTVVRMKKDFPGWTLEHGVCRRCTEMYEAGSGLELPATICL